MSATGYRTQAPDTSIDAERVQFARLRELGPAGRAALFAQLCDSVRCLAYAGIRYRYPDASEREVLLRFAARHLDRATMIAAYGWDPESEADCVHPDERSEEGS